MVASDITVVAFQIRLAIPVAQSNVNLGFVVLCIFNHSNKNTQLDATINHKIYCFVIQTLLNMVRALPCPSSGARQTAIAASGFIFHDDRKPETATAV
jgi:hypothetical protein